MGKTKKRGKKILVTKEEHFAVKEIVKKEEEKEKPAKPTKVDGLYTWD